MEAIGKRESEVGGGGCFRLGQVPHRDSWEQDSQSDGKKRGRKEGRRTPSHRRRDSSKDQEVEERGEGFGKGKVMSWTRTATNYSQLRTNKGALQAWRFKIGKAEGPGCRYCGNAVETRDHLVLRARNGGSCVKRSEKPRRRGGGIGKISTAATRSSTR